MNAEKVDGLQASRKPRPGRLIVLDSQGKLPTSVLPVAPTQGAKGDPGPQGLPGPQGAQGLPGSGGTVRAYALVDPAALAFNLARTKNFTAITRPSTGTYCLTPTAGVDPSQVPAMVQPERLLSSANVNFAYLFSAGTDCPTGAFEVKTYMLPTGGIVLDAQPANTVGFTILVP